jgi:multiple sugar transport system ATP-binding protein
MAGVTLSGVTKEYDNGFQAVKNLDLDIEDGEFLVMVGPSGCGKSTTLRMIAGLEDISAGELKIGDRVVNDVHPKDRDIAMVFQNYALYPHMTVADNIGFALKLAGRPKSEIKERVGDAARLLELTDQLNKKPGELSGGQRQRVAMGRAIVRRPQVFLLDEPLSNLDAKLRVQMRAEITELQRNVGVTTFYVTHDQVEAMTMADRVAVINAGILQQVAAPQTLFDMPDNLFVAAFIGSPSMNLMEGVVTEAGGQYKLQLGSHSLDLAPSIINDRPDLGGYLGKTVVVGIRPKDFEDAAIDKEHGSGLHISAKVENVEALGFEKIVYFDIDAKQVIQEDALDLDEDAEVIHHGEGTRISGRFSPASKARVGDTINVAVAVEEAHFFDMDSGLAIRG